MIQLPENPIVILPRLSQMLQRARQTPVVETRGRVVQLTGLVIESEGPQAAVGEVCRIESAPHDGFTLAEVVWKRIWETRASPVPS